MKIKIKSCNKYATENYYTTKVEINIKGEKYNMTLNVREFKDNNKHKFYTYIVSSDIPKMWLPANFPKIFEKEINKYLRKK